MYVYIFISVYVYFSMFIITSLIKKKKINNNVITIMGNFNIGINYVD